MGRKAASQQPEVDNLTFRDVYKMHLDLQVVVESMEILEQYFFIQRNLFWLQALADATSGTDFIFNETPSLCEILHKMNEHPWAPNFPRDRQLPYGD